MAAGMMPPAAMGAQMGGGMADYYNGSMVAAMGAGGISGGAMGVPMGGGMGGAMAGMGGAAWAGEQTGWTPVMSAQGGLHQPMVYGGAGCGSPGSWPAAGGGPWLQPAAESEGGPRWMPPLPPGGAPPPPPPVPPP
eukprot:1536411-Prymnesium_polylepis.1